MYKVFCQWFAWIFFIVKIVIQRPKDIEIKIMTSSHQQFGFLRADKEKMNRRYMARIKIIKIVLKKPDMIMSPGEDIN